MSEPTTPAPPRAARLISLLRHPLTSGVVLFGVAAALYAYTAAPSVMGGDSAEFQMAAPLLGVPHPTTYPLSILLGKLFTLAVPLGDLAHRVTLVSSFGAALAVALLGALARRLTGSALGGWLAALALMVAPGLWNAATMAEVYGLLAALIAGCWLAVAHVDAARLRALADGLRRKGLAQLWDHVQPSALLAAFLAGLGIAHHGLFVFTTLPFVALALLLYACWPRALGAGRGRGVRSTMIAVASLGLSLALGLTPWLFPLIQYARFGPFSGENYGLPRFYFWGSPTRWADAIGMLAGGPMRQGVFRIPTPEAALAVLANLGTRLQFEFGTLGLALATIGCGWLLWRSWRAWLGAACIGLGTLIYLLLLGPAVQDAPIFTLPMLLPLALWAGAGGVALSSLIRRAAGRWDTRVAAACAQAALAALLLLTLAWGKTRAPYANKRHLTVWRDFGQAALAQLPRNAIVMAHWEQGMLLQYLVLAEHQRPDVWVDVVEPTDDPWQERAQERYAGRPVFLVGGAGDVQGMDVTLVLANDYANVYELQP